MWDKVPVPVSHVSLLPYLHIFIVSVKLLFKAV